MSMTALTHCFWLGGDYAKTVILPDDLMVTPVHAKIDMCLSPYEYIDSEVCHSESSGQWYIVIELAQPVPEYPEVNYYLYSSGSWVEIAPCCYIGHQEAPFLWGIPLKGKYTDDQYLPIWESVPTGKYHPEEGYELREERYKLIRLAKFPCVSDPNTYQYNESTYFETIEYTDLIEMVKDIEIFTGIKY